MKTEKKNQMEIQELKNKIDEMKNPLDGLERKLDNENRRINELKESSTAITQTKEQR